jgi:hypothetical protein
MMFEMAKSKTSGMDVIIPTPTMPLSKAHWQRGHLGGPRQTEPRAPPHCSWPETARHPSPRRVAPALSSEIPSPARKAEPSRHPPGRAAQDRAGKEPYPAVHPCMPLPKILKRGSVTPLPRGIFRHFGEMPSFMTTPVEAVNPVHDSII